jgi:hypothetical protein
VYQLSANLTWSSDTITTFFLEIWVDGIYVNAPVEKAWVATGTPDNIHMIAQLSLAPGAVVDLRLRHTAGGSVTITLKNAQFMLARLPA